MNKPEISNLKIEKFEDLDSGDVQVTASAILSHEFCAPILGFGVIGDPDRVIGRVVSVNEDGTVSVLLGAPPAGSGE